MICRLCLNSLNEECAVVLFGADDNISQENHLVKMIKNYLYIELCHDDSISTTICLECCENLLHFHKFWQLIEQKQSALRDEVQKIECEIECEVSGSESEMEYYPIVNAAEYDENNDENNECKPQDLSLKSTVDTASTDMNHLQLAGNGLQSGQQAPALPDMPLDFSSSASTRRTNGALCGAAKRKQRSAVQRRITTSNAESNDERLDSSTETEATRPKRPSNQLIYKENEEIIASFMVLHCAKCELDSQQQQQAEPQKPLQQHARQEYKSFAELRVHFQEAHNDKSPYVKCCDVVFTRPARLVEHVRWHQDPEIYKCYTCGKVLRSKISLQNHLRVTHKCKANPDATATGCASSSSSTETGEHNTTDDTADIIQDVKVKLEMSLESTMMTAWVPPTVPQALMPASTPATPDARTAAEPPAMATAAAPAGYACVTCGQYFQCILTFDRHMLEHQAVFETRVQCQNCDEWLNNESSLSQHQCKGNILRQRTALDIEMDIVCNTCGKVCATHSALLGHMQYAHKMLKRFSCEYCEKTFKQKRYLDEHVATHTGEKAYTCPYCPTPFRCKSNMYTHVKRKHMTEWLHAKKAKANAERASENAMRMLQVVAVENADNQNNNNYYNDTDTGNNNNNP